MKPREAALLLVLLVGISLFTVYEYVLNRQLAELSSPYVAKAHQYKGQLHSHSVVSERYGEIGYQTPTQLVTAYKNAGYNFVAITDANTYTPDPGVAGILEIGGEEVADYRHIIALNIRSSVPLDHNAQDEISAILAQGGVAQLAHPDYVPTQTDSSRSWPYSVLGGGLAGYNFIELASWAEGEGTPGEANGTLGEQKWDYILTTLGKTVYGTAVDDCHDTRGSQFNRDWVVVYANTLTVSDIVTNMKNGNFYATNGPSLSSLTISPSLFGLTISVSTDSSSVITWIGSGGSTLRNSTSTTSDSYRVTGSERYVRIRITRITDHKIAWTQPIFVSSTLVGTSGTVHSAAAAERSGNPRPEPSQVVLARGIIAGSETSVWSRQGRP